MIVVSEIRYFPPLGLGLSAAKQASLYVVLAELQQLKVDWMNNSSGGKDRAWLNLSRHRLILSLYHMLFYLCQQVLYSILRFGQSILSLSDQSQTAPLQVRCKTINSIRAKMVKVKGILKSEHLPRPDGIQDLQLIFSKLLSKFLQVFLVLRDGGGGSATDCRDFFENLLALFRQRRFERIETEIHCLGNAFVGELTAHISIGSPLYDLQKCQ